EEVVLWAMHLLTPVGVRVGVIVSVGVSVGVVPSGIITEPVAQTSSPTHPLTTPAINNRAQQKADTNKSRLKLIASPLPYISRQSARLVRLTVVLQRGITMW